MNPERWQQIDQLLQSALEREPEQRSAFLAEACAGDEPLRGEVESLIASHEELGSILEKPLSQVAAQLGINSEARLADGQKIGRYQVMALLGEGGMGAVYLVQDTVLGRQVALKLLPGEFTRDADRLRRFEQEARAASALNHPNIVTIHEIGQLDGAHFIITEFIEGQTLRQQMQTGLSLCEVLDVTSQVASALAAAHAAGIVHRDIKPENIMRRIDGFVKVLDFGLAKLTSSAKVEAKAPASKALVNTNPGTVIGTAQYMSPEQARGDQELDARTDTWSLGVVLYEMITGGPPFDGETPSHVIVSILEKDFAPLGHNSPEVPDELARIVSKTLRKNREERYQTVKELGVDLLSLKQELDADARFERSTHSKTSDRKKAIANRSGAALETANKSASRTVDVGVVHLTSSAEYVINEIKRHKRSAIVIASAIAIAVATLAYLYFEKVSVAIDSVAVLPLLNLNADPNMEYLSDGISESIVNSLTQLPNLNVKPLSSVLRYKGRQIDAQTAGRELGVTAVVMGWLTQHGDDLAINIELVDVRDNRRLWGRQYDRKLADVLVLPQEISREISQRVQPKLSGEDRRQLTKNYPNSEEAYQEFLKGRHHLNHRTAEELTLASQFFQRAIELDRNYSLAYAGLALTSATLGRRGVLSPIEAYPRASAAASRALEIDETLADAHNAQGMVKMDFDRDFVGAEKEFKRAIELDPRNTDAHHAYSHFLVALGRTEQSLAESKRALEIDPLNLVMNSHLAWHYLFARDYGQAIKQGRQTLDMGEDYWAHFYEDYWAHFYLGQAYEQTERYEEAIVEFKKALVISPESDEATAAMGHTYAISGRKREAQQLITELNESAKRRYVSLGCQSMIYAGLNDNDQALKWLQEAFDERAGWLVYLNVDPRYDGLRSDPRFKDLLRRMKLEGA